MANISYCVYFFALILMSICVWLAVASIAVSTEELKHLTEDDGELIFVHVVRERFSFSFASFMVDKIDIVLYDDNLQKNYLQPI